jgi:hypothetical protein
MHTQEKALAVQLSAVIDVLEKRIDHATRQSLESTQALDQQFRRSLDTANALTREALEQFRQGAKLAVETGIRDAVDELDHTVRIGTSRVDHATAQLNQRMQQMGRFHTEHAWKTFVASALGSLAVISAALFASWHAHADIKRSEWVQDINMAIDSGRLATCPEGGLCALIGNKWCG